MSESGLEAAIQGSANEIVFGSRGINSCHATAGNYPSSWIVTPGTTALAISHRCW